MKLSHIGIAVKNLDASVELFSRLLKTDSVERESVAGQKVNIAFFHVGEVHIELTEATTADSPIAKFIEKRGEGVHHLSFDVEDIRVELKRLASAGFELVDTEPKPGAGGCLVAFLHPKSTNGVLVELSQRTK